jgi:cell division protein FtsB
MLNTKLNIHQLTHNNSLLEARILELEEEIKKLKGENVDNCVDNM